jgi:hypothetical protein
VNRNWVVTKSNNSSKQYEGKEKKIKAKIRSSKSTNLQKSVNAVLWQKPREVQDPPVSAVAKVLYACRKPITYFPNALDLTDTNWNFIRVFNSRYHPDISLTGLIKSQKMFSRLDSTIVHMRLESWMCPSTSSPIICSSNRSLNAGSTMVSYFVNYRNGDHTPRAR